MTDILGHDCDGRPLRKGDKVMPAPGANVSDNITLSPPWTVDGTHTLYDTFFNPVKLLQMSESCPIVGPIVGYGAAFRRVKGESDQPCNQSFEELVQDLKNGMPATPVPARKVGL